MSKNIYIADDVRKNMQAGMNLFADAIIPTLGPLGRNTALQSAEHVEITSDGTSIASDFSLKNPVQNMGAQLLRNITGQAKELTGDGMTTAITLARAMINDGIQNLTAGANPVELRKGMQTAAQLTARAVQKLASPLQSNIQIEQIAETAGDTATDKIIAEAFEHVGFQGLITVSESGELDTSLELREGMQFDRGYLHEAMVTNLNHMSVELEHPFILITDKTISSFLEIQNLAEQAAQKNRPLFIIAEDITGDALSALLINKKRGILKAAAIKPPAYGEGRRRRLEDLAVYTNGTFITEELGYSLKDADIQMLGSAEYITVDRKKTIIIGGNGNPYKIHERIRSLQNKLSRTEHEFDKSDLKERIAGLAGQAACIHIGGASAVEIREKMRRTNNALCAIRCAQKGGIISGGGTAYLNVLPAINAYAESLSGDKKTGVRIIAGAMECPARQIAENAGYDGKRIVREIQSLPTGTGFDVKTGKFVNMEKAGIIDAAGSACMAVTAAVSAAVMFLTTEAGITENKD